VDANSGSVLWRTELPSDVIGTSLAVRGDSIYVAGYMLWSQFEKRLNQVKSGERRLGALIEIPQLHAIDLETGSIRWSRPLQPYYEKHERIHRATLMPAENGVLVHKNSIRGRRDAEFFDSSTGERRWAISVLPRPERWKPRPPSWLGPVAYERFAVFREKSMDLYSIQTGEKLDSTEGEWLEYFSEMQFENQRMYQYWRGYLRAFDLTTGKTIWVRELGIDVGWKGNTDGHCPMHIVDGVISIGADDGFIYLVNAEDGSIRARTGYGGSHRSTPAFIFGDGVIVHDSTNIVSMRPHSFWEKMNPFFSDSFWERMNPFF
jgi:outer membrane protein assembly factor BamB